MGEKDFTRPLPASEHCRHYSYVAGMDGGPRCAVGLQGGEPKLPLRTCCSTPPEACPGRQEYTDAERDAWEAWSEARTLRILHALSALPKKIPVNTSGVVTCPNCGGQLRYARWHRGAGIVCSTSNCCEARFNLAANAEWPQG